MRRLLSSLAEIRNLPPGWNTRSFTQLSWPTSVMRHLPLLASHILIVLSRDPDARYSLLFKSTIYYYYYCPDNYYPLRSSVETGSCFMLSSVVLVVDAKSSFFFLLANLFAYRLFFIYCIFSAFVSFLSPTTTNYSLTSSYYIYSSPGIDSNGLLPFKWCPLLSLFCPSYRESIAR